MKKVLIIGGSGFIGSSLAKYFFIKGYEISVFDRARNDHLSNIRTYIGNAYDIKELKELIKDFDIIINAISIVSPANQFTTFYDGYAKDIELNLRLMNILQNCATKYLFISSAGAIYGDTGAKVLNEKACVRPINYYGSIKLSIESICHVMNNITHSHRFISVRIANAFGPNQDYKKGVGFIDAVLKCALFNETLHIFGDGKTVRDYIYIDDICKLIEKIVNYEGNEDVFNLSTNIGYSQNQIINMVESLGYDIKKKYVESREGDINKAVIDNSLIRKLFGYEPMKMEEALKFFIANIKRVN